MKTPTAVEIAALVVRLYRTIDAAVEIAQQGGLDRAEFLTSVALAWDRAESQDLERQ